MISMGDSINIFHYQGSRMLSMKKVSPFKSEMMIVHQLNQVGVYVDTGVEKIFLSGEAVTE